VHRAVKVARLRCCAGGREGAGRALLQLQLQLQLQLLPWAAENSKEQQQRTLLPLACGRLLRMRCRASRSASCAVGAVGAVGIVEQRLERGRCEEQGVKSKEGGVKSEEGGRSTEALKSEQVPGSTWKYMEMRSEHILTTL
jgi:hypothetical protein